jgi:hypothetical protein
MLLLWVALLVVALWVFFPRVGTTHFHSYVEKLHPYSGLNPELFGTFQYHVAKFEETVQKDPREASEHLYLAIDTAKDLALNIRRADDGDIQEQILAVTNQMGLEGETLINQTVLKKGLRFTPKYLNDTLLYYADESRDPNTLGTNFKATRPL